ncbi:hypothetical protein RhiirA4_496381 [Rhizophagus irregularis]|uniref:Uncharacterized protein n=1 Tax=Rhizophagus irregularis TaxID=588596 RepID=A0A2I1H0L5_9GLOM|nr:hypothetical protein RhiirA4_496381 [Rhizophagus irregularis]
MSHDVTKKVKEVERKEKIILEKNEKIRKVSQEVESTRLEIKRVKSNTQKGKKEQENAEWLKRANVNMMVDNKKVDPAARPLMKDVGTTMGVRLEERDTNRRGSEYVYTEKDVEEMIARMKEEH